MKNKAVNREQTAFKMEGKKTHFKKILPGLVCALSVACSKIRLKLKFSLRLFSLFLTVQAHLQKNIL